ncbi:MAG: hypothetical protein ACREMQ_10985 [Longimicrobiales bacterium]
MAALVVSGAAAPVVAQQASSSQPPARPVSAIVTRTEDPKLIFEREIFTYPAENRRDPFKPLGNLGPMFEDLKLRMIIYSRVPNQSVVVLADGAKKTYRLRRGQTLGNTTVIEITPTRVIFVVEDYGNRRQEILDIRPNKETEGA